MRISDLLKKMRAGEQLSDEEQTFVDSYSEPDVEKLANDRAAKARLEFSGKLKKADEEKSVLQQQLEALQQKIDAAEGKEKSELEKLQAKLEKLTTDLETEKAERTKAAAENAKLIRGQKVDKAFAKIKLIEGVNVSDARVLVDHLLTDVDLDDEEMVDLKLDEFRQRNKPLILTESKSGTGSRGDKGGAGGRGKISTVDTSALLEMATSGNIAEAEKALADAGAAIKAGAKVT